MNVLIVTWHGGGNIWPMLATCTDLVQAGHAVTVLSNPVLAERYAATGARFFAFKRVPAHDSSTPETDLVRLHEGRSIAETNEIIGQRLIFGLAHSLCDDTLEVIDAIHPHVVVADYVLPGAMTAADARGLPWVVVSDLLYPLPYAARPRHQSAYAFLFERIARSGLPELNRLRRALSLPEIAQATDLYAGARRFLIMTYAEFAGVEPPERAVYVGPQIEPPPAQEPPPAPPLVVGSFGSVHMDGQTAFISTLIDCLTELPVRAVLGTGASRVERNHGANVETAPFVPILERLPQASLAVNHGGGGSILRALAHGVPQMCVPFVADQFEYARRVADLGVGLSVKKGCTVAECNEALEALLYDPRYRHRSRELADSVRASHAPRRAAQAIEAASGVA